MLGPGPGASDAALFQYKTPLPPNFGDTPKARGENLLNQLENRARSAERDARSAFA